MAHLVCRGQRINSGTTGTAFVRLPPHRINDILLVYVTHQEAAQAANVDVAGFTLKTDHQNGTSSFQLWWKRASSNDESHPVIDHTFANPATWHPMVVRGAIATGDPFDQASSANHAVNSTFTFPDITTSADDELILHLVTSASTPAFGAWTNANISPKMTINEGWPGAGVAGAAFGHMPTAGAIGGTTVALGVSIVGSVASYAFLNGEHEFDIASTFRDSILSTEPPNNSQITLPTHQADDYLCAIIAGSDQALTFAATLSGFTSVMNLPAPDNGRPFSIHKRIATSASETNPTITHGFGVPDDWTVITFSITGELATLLWDGGGNASAVNDIEVCAPATVVGYSNSQGSENWTSYSMAVATNETEQEDGGAGTCKATIYTADMAAAGNIGIAQPVVAFGSAQNWAVLAFSESAARPPDLVDQSGREWFIE